MISLEIDIIYELSPSVQKKKGFFLHDEYLNMRMIIPEKNAGRELKGRVLWENLS
ncbi:hypothetical protein CHCC20335_3622 [Bacillus paralicheniformis]|nr:hypothetical protein CHCC20335_3622 [Bacillus paralicheniformis]